MRKLIVTEFISADGIAEVGKLTEPHELSLISSAHFSNGILALEYAPVRTKE